MKFTDADGPPSKISKELFGLVEKVFPKHIQEQVSEVYPNSYDNFALPGGRNERHFKTIDLNFKSTVGKRKIKGVTVGILKNTSGPQTGYVYLYIDNDNDSETPHVKEFYMEPEKALKALYQNFLEGEFTEARGEILSRKLGIMEHVQSFEMFKLFEKAKSGREKEMVEGIIDILKQVDDIENRRRIADKMMKQFAKENIVVSKEDFFSKLHLD